MEDKLYLENIEEYVYDQDKIVTYKWLAMTLSVSFSEATRMLSEFVQQHSAPPPSKQPNLAIHVTYLVTGISQSTDDHNEKIIVQLADEDELEETKAGVDKVISVIIYSVQKGHQLKDRSSLQTAEQDILQENLHNFSKLCAVKCADSVDEEYGEVKVDRKTSLPMKSEEGRKELDRHIKRDVEVEKSAPQPAKELSMHSTKGKKPTNPKGIAGMFAAKQLKNVAKKSESSQSDKPVQKQEDKMLPTVKKDHGNHSEKAKTAVVSEKAKTTIVKTSAKGNTTTVTTTTKFDNEVFTTGDDDHDDDVDHVDHDQDHNDNGVTKEIKEHQRSGASAAATSQVKEQKKGKNVKRRRVCQELSSEESDEDNSVATKKTTKTQSASVDSTGVKKKRKIVRRLVDSMYIDEDGAMVTEKVWKEVSTDDDEEEMMVAASSKPKTIPLVKAKSKQSSLSAFFHRK